MTVDKKDMILKTLDRWIEITEEQVNTFDKYGMVSSKSVTLASLQSYKNVRNLILSTKD